MGIVVLLTAMELDERIDRILFRVCRYDNSPLIQVKQWLSRFNALNANTEQLSFFNNTTLDHSPQRL